jgi:hypothetical protein
MPMPTNEQNFKVEGDPLPLWRVWRVDDTGYQISLVAEGQTREELSYERRADWHYRIYRKGSPVD